MIKLIWIREDVKKCMSANWVLGHTLFRIHGNLNIIILLQNCAFSLIARFRSSIIWQGKNPVPGTIQNTCKHNYNYFNSMDVV